MKFYLGLLSTSCNFSKFLLIHLKTYVPQDFLYLSGFLEPDSALVLHGKGRPDQAILFVPRRDPGRELWDGPRSGKDGAAALTGIERVHSIEELGVVLKSLKGGCMGVAAGGLLFAILRREKKKVLWFIPTRSLTAISFSEKGKGGPMVLGGQSELRRLLE